MNITAVIPARYHSTRFEGKPLALIDGIPMVERVYRQVEKSGKFAPGHILVATDDLRIASVVSGFGGTAVMTAAHHQSGSERIWEVLDTHDADAVINIQGDEPVIPESLISRLVDELQTEGCEVVTPACFNDSYDDFLSPHVVKVVTDTVSDALYFSRSPIPFTEKKAFTGFYQHMGMYGYSRRALGQFIRWPRSCLEGIEKLEQLRFIENNIKIKVIISEYHTVGVDIPSDILKVEKLLKELK
ncbi:MAG: 3-deoxy-manno-octulosonate cytidylyltransferase [Candidatus Omnitrophota bacterium]